MNYKHEWFNNIIHGSKKLNRLVNLTKKLPMASKEGEPILDCKMQFNKHVKKVLKVQKTINPKLNPDLRSSQLLSN